MDVSLLRQQAKWKERVEALRHTVDGLQPHYSGMKGWRMHWDMQLFKALEYQYQVFIIVQLYTHAIHDHTWTWTCPCALPAHVHCVLHHAPCTMRHAPCTVDGA